MIILNDITCNLNLNLIQNFKLNLNTLNEIQIELKRNGMQIDVENLLVMVML
jgi:hypothetical protein